MIPYGRQQITEEDIHEVVKVLQSDFLTQGPLVPSFESDLTSICSVKNAIAVNSCTAALHLACLSMGLSEGDLVWTSPITFVSSANCALYCGAEIDFVDVDPETALMDVKALKSKLEKAEIEGNIPKIIIPVHFAGQSCDMKEIFNLSKKFGFKIIEDAAHAIGAFYQGHPVGSCRYSDITVLSFHPVKIVTTGEGGAALTNNNDYAKKMKLLRSHGITRNSIEMESNSENSWYYEQLELGFNYRMNDIGAALGRSQLRRLQEFVKKRSKVADWYNRNLTNIKWLKPLLQNNYSLSSHHLYVVRVLLGDGSRDKIIKYLRKNGIGVNVHYIPVYKQPFHRKAYYLEGAEEYYQSCISLPIYPEIKEIELKRVLKELIDAYNKV